MPSGRYCNKYTTLKGYILFKLKNLVRIPTVKSNIDLFIVQSGYMLRKIK
ncbi:unnamed protein product [marine sediment metagenome]|uniref:Uncharacterized protein n=1 Tax=marine sediment metagenome TaxID=412755 RepID=X1P3N1_9ZZZZ